MTTPVAVCMTWSGEGEPEGWSRHPASGRYRTGGDPAKEHLGDGD